jgi:hypothetical protein
MKGSGSKSLWIFTALILLLLLAFVFTVVTTFHAYSVPWLGMEGWGNPCGTVVWKLMTWRFLWLLLIPLFLLLLLTLLWRRQLLALGSLLSIVVLIFLVVYSAITYRQIYDYSILAKNDGEKSYTRHWLLIETYRARWAVLYAYSRDDGKTDPWVADLKFEWDHWYNGPPQKPSYGSGEIAIPAWLARLGFHASRTESHDKRSDYWEQSISAPDWVPGVLCIPLPALWMRRLLRLRHRRKHGLCVICGYDLRASKERCPNCGNPIEPCPDARHNFERATSA